MLSSIDGTGISYGPRERSVVGRGKAEWLLLPWQRERYDDCSSVCSCCLHCLPAILHDPITNNNNTRTPLIELNLKWFDSLFYYVVFFFFI
jgi:hypothetical protein